MSEFSELHMQVEGQILLSQDIPDTNKSTGDMQYVCIFQLSQLLNMNKHDVVFIK